MNNTFDKFDPITKKLLHPETIVGHDVWLGNFTAESAKAIGWHSKHAGCWSFWVDSETPFPEELQFYLRPYFVDAKELIVAGLTADPISDFAYRNLSDFSRTGTTSLRCATVGLAPASRI